MLLGKYSAWTVVSLSNGPIAGTYVTVSMPTFTESLNVPVPETVIAEPESMYPAPAADGVPKLQRAAGDRGRAGERIPIVGHDGRAGAVLDQRQFSPARLVEVAFHERAREGDGICRSHDQRIHATIRGNLVRQAIARRIHHRERPAAVDRHRPRAELEPAAEAVPTCSAPATVVPPL